MFQTLDEELALCGNSLKQQGESSEQVGPPTWGWKVYENADSLG